MGICAEKMETRSDWDSTPHSTGCSWSNIHQRSLRRKGFSYSGNLEQDSSPWARGWGPSFCLECEVVGTGGMHPETRRLSHWRCIFCPSCKTLFRGSGKTGLWHSRSHPGSWSGSGRRCLEGLSQAGPASLGLGGSALAPKVIRAVQPASPPPPRAPVFDVRAVGF